MSSPPLSLKRKREEKEEESISDDYEYIINENNSLKEDFSCFICANILKAPRTHNCRITYCLNCFRRAGNRCPNCREDSTDLPESPIIIQQILDKLSVKCNFCAEILPLPQFRGHNRYECKIACSNSGCTTVSKGSIVARKHDDECPLKIVECSAVVLPDDDDLDLFETMPGYDIFDGEFRCDWQGVRRILHDHQKVCVFLHLINTDSELERLNHRRLELSMRIKCINHFTRPEYQVTADQINSKQNALVKVDQFFRSSEAVCVQYTVPGSATQRHEHISIFGRNIYPDVSLYSRLYRSKEDPNQFYIVYKPESNLNHLLYSLTPYIDWKTNHERMQIQHGYYTFLYPLPSNPPQTSYSQP